MVYIDPIFVYVGPKMAVLEAFTNFFENYRNKFINTNWIP